MMTIAIIAFILLLAGLLFRLVLPSLLLRKINSEIATLEDFNGYAKGLRLNLFQGRLILSDVSLDRRTETSGKPFFTAPEICIDFQWTALFSRQFVGDIVISRAALNFSKDKTAEKSFVKKTSKFDLKKAIKSVRPFAINIRLADSAIYYTESGKKSTVQLELTGLNAILSGFSNISHPADPLPVKFVASAYIYGGTLSFTMGLDPLADSLTFDMNTNVRSIQLPLLNEFLRAHAGIDVNKGTFDMYTEVAARDGEFKGYIKPIIRDLDVVGGQDRNDKLLTRVWEGFVATVYQILKNKSKDQFATKISIQGRLDDPHINIVSAVLYILRNAFIRAIKPSFEDVISLKSVRTGLRVGGAIKRFFSRRERVGG